MIISMVLVAVIFLPAVTASAFDLQIRITESHIEIKEPLFPAENVIKNAIHMEKAHVVANNNCRKTMKKRVSTRPSP